MVKDIVFDVHVNLLQLVDFFFFFLESFLTLFSPSPGQEGLRGSDVKNQG